MRITIDPALCSGHGRCYTLAPSLFADDERGFGQVRGDGTVASDLAGDAEVAVRACPEMAITLDTDA